MRFMMASVGSGFAAEREILAIVGVDHPLQANKSGRNAARLRRQCAAPHIRASER
jgi:hypothetical protein